MSSNSITEGVNISSARKTKQIGQLKSTVKIRQTRTKSRAKNRTELVVLLLIVCCCWRFLLTIEFWFEAKQSQSHCWRQQSQFDTSSSSSVSDSSLRLRRRWRDEPLPIFSLSSPTRPHKRQNPNPISKRDQPVNIRRCRASEFSSTQAKKPQNCSPALTTRLRPSKKRANIFTDTRRVGEYSKLYKAVSYKAVCFFPVMAVQVHRTERKRGYRTPLSSRRDATCGERNLIHPLGLISVKPNQLLHGS